MIHDPGVRRQAVHRVLWITLGLNGLVSGGKILVGRLSGSLAMEADGYHSLLDGANNVLGLMVTGLACAPPCRDHPYGHRKYETTAVVLIGLGLLALAYKVVEAAFFRVSEGRLPEIGVLAWLVIGVASAINLGVAWYETREGHHLGSEYLLADAAHTRADVYVTLGVIASFAGARAGLAWVDPIVAAAIACLVAVLAAQILLGAFHVLTDRAVIPADEVERVVCEQSGALGCRDVRTRGRSDAAYVDLVVLADGDLTLDAAHRLSNRIGHALRRTHPQIVDLVVRVEPAPRPQ